MNRNDFERLYFWYERKSVCKSEIEKGNRLRINWDEFDQFAISSDPDRMISKSEAHKDISHFFLLLEYAYSGFEYYSSIVDFKRLKEQIIKDVENFPETNISSVDLCKIIYRVLSPHINDGHVWVEYAGFQCLFIRSFMPFVTDIVVKRVSEEFIVIQGDERLQPGSVIRKADVGGELFRTLVSGCCEDCYLIGCYTEKDPGDIEIAGRNYKTHVLKSCNSKSLSEKLYSFAEEAGYAVFENPTYQMYEDSDAYEQSFLNAGKKSSSKGFVIWDLSNNHGGNSVFPEIYLRALNDYVYTEMDEVVLQSPVVGNSETEKFYRCKRASKFDNSNASYAGELFIVMNKETGSSAELAVFYAKSCRKVTTVGAPSAGIGIFGEVRSYRLPNSGILVGLPYKVFYEDDFEIGKGYMPDYWIDDENPVEYLLHYLATTKENG